MTQLASTPFSTLLQRLRTVVRPEVLPSIPAGLITGVVGAMRAISYASLIFSGPLAAFLPAGLGMALFSTSIISAVVAVLSTLPGLIATPLAAPTAIVALLAADLAEALSTQVTGDALLATVLAAIALSSLVTGLLLLVLGVFKLGERIRVVPYPVIGGFMAGTGWLLVKGFVQVCTDLPLTVRTLPQLVEPQQQLCWLPGLGFALLLLLLTRRFDQPWVLPVSLLGCTGLFYLGLWASHMPLSVAREQGLLLGPFPDTNGGLWQPLTLSMLGQVDWGAIAAQSGTMLTIAFVSLLSLLLSNSSIELVADQDMDLSREMQAVGIGNLASGLGGGMVGSQAMPSTLLAYDMGAPFRMTGLITTLPAIAVLVVGAAFLAYLPKALLGCLLLYLGLSLLLQWFYRAYFQLPLMDYLAVWVTVVVIDAVGFLQGVAAGFGLTVLTFMYQYSHVDVAKEEATGAGLRSNLDRTPEQQQRLATGGEQIYLLELQGFLFFGTATYLMHKVSDRLQTATEAEAGPPPLRYVVLDFRQVVGLDSSAVLIFSKLLRQAHRQSFTLVFTNLSATLAAQLQRGDGFDEALDYCHQFPDLDRGLEWCEQQLLGLGEVAAPPASPIQTQLSQLFLTQPQAERFMPYLEPQSLPACHYIFRRGEAVSDLYFVESGQISVLLDAGECPKRLKTLFGGGIVGEMRFFGKVPISTSVVTGQPSQVHRLSQAAFSRMNEDDPDLAQALQAHIISMLCDSLIRREEQLRVTR
ncbi:MAG: SulP family inorganic anion transporter [Cyanobacteria bacterium P01_A01_bin.135]